MSYGAKPRRNPVLQRAILARAALGPVTSANLVGHLAGWSMQSLRKHLQTLADDGHLHRRPGPRAVVTTYDITAAGRTLLDQLQHTPEERRHRHHRAALDLARALGYPTGATT